MPFARSHTRTPLRHALHGAALVGMLGGGVAIGSIGGPTANTTAVTLAVDGHDRMVRTTATTVAGVLRQAGVAVGAHDVLAPAPDTPVHRGSRIVVEHARPLTLAIDGQWRTIWVTQPTVQAAVAALGLRLDGADVSASRSGRIPLTGTTVVVRLPQPVQITVGRQRRAVVSTSATVSDLLAVEGVRLGPLDRVSVPLTAYPTAGMSVVVQRVARRIARVITGLPAPTVRVADAALLRGRTAVQRAGRAGRLVQWYSVTTVDGRPAGKRLVKVGRMRPVSRVIAYGTRTPPPPPPPPPAPAPVPAPVRSYVAPTGGGLNWAALAQCESGGNPTIADPPYYGLYQFSIGTWEAVGGTGLPSQASAAEQTYRAQLLYARAGRSPWPVCGRYL